MDNRSLTVAAPIDAHSEPRASASDWLPYAQLISPRPLRQVNAPVSRSRERIRFAISGANLVVANYILLDFEQASSHSITVRVTDSGGLTFESDGDFRPKR